MFTHSSMIDKSSINDYIPNFSFINALEIFIWCLASPSACPMRRISHQRPSRRLRRRTNETWEGYLLDIHSMLREMFIE